MSLRTKREEWRYKRILKKQGSVPLCDLPAIREWTYWKLVTPTSKHNRHHTEHLMLVLKRPCDNFYEKATNNEIYELIREVLPEFKKEWHYLKINFDPMISVPDYVHFHVMKLKRRYQ